MAAAILGAALAGGAGGLIGGILAKLIGDRHAHRLQEQLEHGACCYGYERVMPHMSSAPLTY
jgi:hypothetical protein